VTFKDENDVRVHLTNIVFLLPKKEKNAGMQVSQVAIP
jgi:hypothetical protein